MYGNLLTETKPNGAIYRYDYDVMNRVKNEYFKDNASAVEVLLMHYEYSILSDGSTQKTETQYLSTTDSANTTYIYDYAGMLVEKQNPDGTKLKIHIMPMEQSAQQQTPTGAFPVSIMTG